MSRIDALTGRPLHALQIPITFYWSKNQEYATHDLSEMIRLNQLTIPYTTIPINHNDVSIYFGYHHTLNDALLRMRTWLLQRKEEDLEEKVPEIKIEKPNSEPIWVSRQSFLRNQSIKKPTTPDDAPQPDSPAP